MLSASSAMDGDLWAGFASVNTNDFASLESSFPSVLGLSSQGMRLAERLGNNSDAPSFDVVKMSGNGHFDGEAIRNFFVSYLAAMPEGCGDLNVMQLQWCADRRRSDAVDSLYGTFQNIFLHNPHLFRVGGHPAKVYLAQSKKGSDSVAEDNLLSVAASVTSQLFSSSPGRESPTDPLSNSPFMSKKRPEADEPDEKDVMVREVVERLKAAPEQCLKKDDLGSDLVKNARKLYDQICDLFGSLQDMLRAYPDLFVLAGDIPGKETVKLRRSDDETKLMEDKRVILEAVKTLLKHNYSVMHPDDLRDELHRTKPMIMGRITTLYGGFSQLLRACSDTVEVVDDPKLLTPPFVRLRWPAFCAICGVWPETPEAWQGHVFSEKHKDMRRSVVRLKDGRDPDRWPVLRMIEERIRRAGGRMKLGNIPNFGKNRPLFATYVRKLYGGFKQLVESNPRFKVVSEDGSADPTVILVDDWRQDRLEGVVIRVKQKDTLIWIRPDTNPNIEFFLHKDRSLGGREIANSPAFVVPRVGDRMSFMPSDVPADPNPFAEGAVVLESVPDFRVRFSGTIVHHERDRYLLRADFQTAAGPQDSGDLFEVVWRDDAVKMAVVAGHTRVTFVRSCRPSRGQYPLADDVTLDIPLMSMSSSRMQQQQMSQQQSQQLLMQMPSQQHFGNAVATNGPAFAFTSDATFRGRPAGAAPHDVLSSSAADMRNSGMAGAGAAVDPRNQRGQGRFQTWPVVYFDAAAAAASKSAAGGDAESSASSTTSGESTPATPKRESGSGPGPAVATPIATVAPSSGASSVAAAPSPVRDSRTPLKFNPTRPIVEFAFRAGGAAVPVMNPAVPPSQEGLQQQSTVAAPTPLAQQPPPPAVSTRHFTVKLTVQNDEAELRALIAPQVMALLNAKAPNFPNTLVSIAMDVGALPVVSFTDGTTLRGEELVTADEVNTVVAGMGNLGPEGSSVVRHSLHLCSTIVHPISRELMGYTLKVGRSVIGLADVFDKVIGPQASVLVLGEFCTGKTVLLRDLARRQAGDASGKLVAVVDTSGELGGAADGKSHPGLGLSRCVRCVKKGQLPEAVDSTVGRHGIASVVVDGIANAESVSAVLRTRRRGVAVICSIGAASLAAAACDEVFRPLLSRLPGGRKTPHVKPPFDIAIELTATVGKWILHENINASIDALLNKQPLSVSVSRITVNSDTGEVTWERGLYPTLVEMQGGE